MKEFQKIAARLRAEFNSIRALFGSSNGLATLDGSGHLPDTQLSLAGKSTDDLAEGSNLYFTDARATDAVSGALSAKQDTSEKGQPNGYASLDGSGQVPSAQLPAETTDHVHQDPASDQTWYSVPSPGTYLIVLFAEIAAGASHELAINNNTAPVFSKSNGTGSGPLPFTFTTVQAISDATNALYINSANSNMMLTAIKLA
ncbi:MAG: hypothetical protein RH862_20485 [Leptospiraceae bacterium]